MPFDNSDRPRRGRGTGERAINLPPAVMWLIGINVAVQLLRSLLGEATDNVIILMFGLVPAAYTGGDSDLLTQIAAPVTYQFLHGGWMHLVINMVTLAAFGAPVVVRVELGTLELKSREWAEIALCNTYRLSRKLGDPSTLRFGGVPVSNGRLSEIAG